MIHIAKGKEPKEWLEYRLTPGANFQSIPALREALLREQGHLCAYCMRRIDTRSMKIEHLACQSQYPEKQFEYNNLLACCSGESCGERHCDTSKGDRMLTISPLRPECIKSLSYSTTGILSSDRPVWDREINEVLNLNIHILKDNRKAILQSLIHILRSIGYTSSALSRQLSRYQALDSSGKRKAYCGIAIWYLEKKLKQIEK